MPVLLPAVDPGLQALAGRGIGVSLVKVKGSREDQASEAAEAFLLPLRVSPACAPAVITVDVGPTAATGRPPAAAAASLAPAGALSSTGEEAEGMEQALLPEKDRQQSAAMGEVKGGYGGVVAATGARLVAGEWVDCKCRQN